LGKRQSAIALVGGPLMSLVLAILFTSLSLLVSQGVVQQFASWTAIFTFIQFLGTIIPLTYPGWMGGYSGFPSDGLQLIDRKSTRLNSSHVSISYAVFCLKKK